MQSFRDQIYQHTGGSLAISFTKLSPVPRGIGKRKDVGNRVAVLGDSHSGSVVSVEHQGRLPLMVLSEFSAIVLATASVPSADGYRHFGKFQVTVVGTEQFRPALTQQQFLQRPCVLHQQHEDMSPGLAHL